MGTFLVIAGLVLLTFALTEGPSAGWRTPCSFFPFHSALSLPASDPHSSYSLFMADIIAFFIVSGAFLLAFAGWEHFLVHSARFSIPPLLPLEIFLRGRVLLVMVVGLTTWAAFQPLLLYIVRELIKSFTSFLTIFFLPFRTKALILSSLLLVCAVYYQQYAGLTPMQTMVRLLPTAVR